jgi:hypothetical protein
MSATPLLSRAGGNAIVFWDLPGLDENVHKRTPASFDDVSVGICRQGSSGGVHPPSLEALS